MLSSKPDSGAGASKTAPRAVHALQPLQVAPRVLCLLLKGVIPKIIPTKIIMLSLSLLRVFLLLHGTIPRSIYCLY